MIDWNTLKAQTIGYRKAIAALLEAEGPRADIIPPTWNNNLHWHAGHLVTTVHLLTRGLAHEPLGIPAEYRKWFGKGTSPADWPGEPIPSLEQLAAELVDTIPPLFDDLEPRATVPFPKPYQTSAGVALRTPAEALSFSMAHDGLHMGMIQALKRGLNAVVPVATHGNID